LQGQGGNQALNDEHIGRVPPVAPETIIYPAIHKVALMTHCILAKGYHDGITIPSLNKKGRSQRDHNERRGRRSFHASPPLQWRQTHLL